MSHAAGAMPLIVSGPIAGVLGLQATVPAVCVPCGLPPGPWIGVSLPAAGGSLGRKYALATILLFVNRVALRVAGRHCVAGVVEAGFAGVVPGRVFRDVDAAVDDRDLDPAAGVRCPPTWFQNSVAPICAGVAYISGR